MRPSIPSNIRCDLPSLFQIRPLIHSRTTRRFTLRNGTPSGRSSERGNRSSRLNFQRSIEVGSPAPGGTDITLIDTTLISEDFAFTPEPGSPRSSTAAATSSRVASYVRLAMSTPTCWNSVSHGDATSDPKTRPESTNSTQNPDRQPTVTGTPYPRHRGTTDCAVSYRQAISEGRLRRRRKSVLCPQESFPADISSNRPLARKSRQCAAVHWQNANIPPLLLCHILILRKCNPVMPIDQRRDADPTAGPSFRVNKIVCRADEFAADVRRMLSLVK